MNRDITEKIRSSYERFHLNEEDLTDDPRELMKRWFSDALKEDIPDANAMTLATVSGDGKPAARTVLLKEIDEDGYLFYTNYKSRKASDLEENDHVALLFYWKEMERQVRIEGVAKKVSSEKSKSYFQSRPLGSQLGAWASPQSKVIGNRRYLEDRLAELESTYANHEKLPLPSFWGGFRVIPEYFEFWQGRVNRLHDRFAYSKDEEENWTISRLAP